MPGVLVDSNVLLDVLTEDPTWFEWSSEALAASAESGPLIIDPIIFAEARWASCASRTSRRRCGNTRW